MVTQYGRRHHSNHFVITPTDTVSECSGFAEKGHTICVGCDRSWVMFAAPIAGGYAIISEGTVARIKRAWIMSECAATLSAVVPDRRTCCSQRASAPPTRAGMLRSNASASRCGAPRTRVCQYMSTPQEEQLRCRARDMNTLEVRPDRCAATRLECLTVLTSSAASACARAASTASSSGGAAAASDAGRGGSASAASYQRDGSSRPSRLFPPSLAPAWDGTISDQFCWPHDRHRAVHASAVMRVSKRLPRQHAGIVPSDGAPLTWPRPHGLLPLAALQRRSCLRIN